MTRFSVSAAPAKEEQTFILGDLRLSVLSDRMLRVERSSVGFCDSATQMAVCRDFAEPRFEIKRAPGGLIIVKTERTAFRVDPRTARTEAAMNGRWTYPSNETNLGGTARTLDGTFGFLGGWKGKKDRGDSFFLRRVGKGIFSSNGVAEIDDSESFLFNEDGSVSLRPSGVTDKYVFAFGDDHLGGLREFYSLCGATPLLPKYVLGNWWSRYHAYTQDEYVGLMDEFERRDIPLTVATVDMDWHIVKNVPKDVKPSKMQVAGWTGYTFEKSLFPDHKKFFTDLKSRGLAITLNLHPHDGVRYYEEQYRDMCEAVGRDPDEKKPVRFDLTDPAFRDAYFDILHHPYEEEGVDFWWIDWQQGTSSPDMLGLDPLWLLNHYHTLDICRGGRKGVILSRYAGIGSHRYPLGFSGDTIVCWNSLRLQPWFTANASNVGYTWWSHDIGGHVLNSGNNELYLRWVQFGVFSPINRLHSSNTSISKEPWNFPRAEKIAEDFLRLRHRLLPYLYTANVLTATRGVPLVCPMYYFDKSADAKDPAYRNQYWFGGQMIVAPVTKPGGKGRANVEFYLPEGRWTHFFTRKVYEGGRYSEHCAPGDYPVFVKEGAIIPLLPERKGNSTRFDEIEVLAFAGKGSYTQYDEDGGEIVFTLDGEEIAVTPGAGCATKKVTVTFVNSDKEDETFNL